MQAPSYSFPLINFSWPYQPSLNQNMKREQHGKEGSMKKEGKALHCQCQLPPLDRFPTIYFSTAYIFPCANIGAFHLVRTHQGGGGWVGSSLLYISIAYYMQKGGEGVQIACKIAYILNGRPHSAIYTYPLLSIEI